MKPANTAYQFSLGGGRDWYLDRVTKCSPGCLIATVGCWRAIGARYTTAGGGSLRT